MGKLTEYRAPEGHGRDLLAICDERNRDRLFARMSRWYHVVQSEGGETISCIQGCDADNIRLLLSGSLQDFVGWGPARMNGYRGWLRKLAGDGLIHQG